MGDCLINRIDAMREDVSRMLVGAILCNRAWSIIAAAFYLISCLAE